MELQVVILFIPTCRQVSFSAACRGMFLYHRSKNRPSFMIDKEYLISAKGDGMHLPNSITKQGKPTNEVEDEWTLIGYNALDGRIPGC